MLPGLVDFLIVNRGDSLDSDRNIPSRTRTQGKGVAVRLGLG